MAILSRKQVETWARNRVSEETWTHERASLITSLIHYMDRADREQEDRVTVVTNSGARLNSMNLSLIERQAEVERLQTALNNIANLIPDSHLDVMPLDRAFATLREIGRLSRINVGSNPPPSRRQAP